MQLMREGMVKLGVDLVLAGAEYQKRIMLEGIAPELLVPEAVKNSIRTILNYEGWYPLSPVTNSKQWANPHAVNSAQSIDTLAQQHLYDLNVIQGVAVRVYKRLTGTTALENLLRSHIVAALLKPNTGSGYDALVVVTANAIEYLKKESI